MNGEGARRMGRRQSGKLSSTLFPGSFIFMRDPGTEVELSLVESFSRLFVCLSGVFLINSYLEANKLQKSLTYPASFDGRKLSGSKEMYGSSKVIFLASRCIVFDTVWNIQTGRVAN